MPMLTPNQVHLDAPLTNLTLAYMQGQDAFIAGKVFPVVDVQKQSDKYYEYNRPDFNRSGDRQLLAPRTRPERVGFSLSNDSYFCDVYGLETDFDTQTLANEDTALDIRSAGAQMLTHRMLIDREVDFATKFFSTGVWGTEVAGGVSGSLATGEIVAWDDYVNSTPIVDVRDARRAVQLKSGGMLPNTMVLSREAYDVLLDHPDILARFEGGATTNQSALTTKAKLAEIFELTNLYVMDAIQNTAAEGATESNSFIGGKHALLVHTPATAGLMTPAAGLTFAWNSLPGASFEGLTVESFRGDWLRSEGIEELIQCKMSYDMKVVGSELGYFWKDIVS